MNNPATGCQCSQPGFCDRHQCPKNEYWFHLCQTRTDYFQLWEQGRGPGQQHVQEPSLVQKAINFGAAVVKHVATGLRNVSEDEYRSRLATCRACSSLDVERMVCKEPDCGCYVEQKARWASEECPLGKWKAEVAAADTS